jgi:hypothetical protein
MATMQGGVSWFDQEHGQWAAAERNRPLTSGDRVSTDAEGRAELRVGSTVLRLAPGSELEVVRIDDDQMRFQLHSGALALRVRSREVAREIELVTAEARLTPQRPGHYRIDRIDDTTYAGTWRGSLRFREGEGYLADTGQRVELWRDGGARELRHTWGALPDDAFARWALSEDRGDERTASQRYVSPEMTGAEDLDRYGRWEQHPEYGAIWFPVAVRVGWAPYRHGRWSWVLPWGWTWVDEAPWGFAPFHYGRWVHWRGHWAWAPGSYVARPVYAPALVAWVGGAHWGVSVNIGAPAIGWVALAPREVFVPYYRSTPVYVDRVNVHPPRHPSHPHRPVPPAQVPTGPIMYGNQGVPGAVTVVSRDVLAQRQPVAPAAVDLQRHGPATQLLHGAVPPPVVSRTAPLAPVAPVPAPVLRRSEPAPVVDLRERGMPPGAAQAPGRGRDAGPARPQPAKVSVPAPVAVPSAPAPAPAGPVAPASKAAPAPAAAAAPVAVKPVAPTQAKPKEHAEEHKRAPEPRQQGRERANLQ